MKVNPLRQDFKGLQDGRNNNHSESLQTHFAQNGGTTVLPIALVEIVDGGGKFLVRALLDGGSERSSIPK